MAGTPDQTVRFESLWRDHYAAVLAYGCRRASPDEAAEMAAEVFTVAWRRLGDVPPDPRPWLLGIARKTLANGRRSAARRSRLQARLAAQPVDAWEPGPARPPGPVLRALAALSERDREVLLLIAWDGLAHDEAAAVCGCSRPALRVRLHRARRRFASELARARAGDAPEVTHPMEAREDTVP